MASFRFTLAALSASPPHLRILGGGTSRRNRNRQVHAGAAAQLQPVVMPRITAEFVLGRSRPKLHRVRNPAKSFNRGPDLVQCVEVSAVTCLGTSIDSCAVR